MSMQTAIEALTPDGVDDLLPLCRAFCAEDGHPFEPDRIGGALRGLIARPHFGTTLVLRHDDRAVGYAVVTLGWSLEGGGLDALLDEVYVVPSARGGGQGTALVEAALDHAAELGAGRIFCEVEDGNHRARRLYRRLGFEVEASQMLLRPLADRPRSPSPPPAARITP